MKCGGGVDGETGSPLGPFWSGSVAAPDVTAGGFNSHPAAPTILHRAARWDVLLVRSNARLRRNTGCAPGLFRSALQFDSDSMHSPTISLANQQKPGSDAKQVSVSVKGNNKTTYGE